MVRSRKPVESRDKWSIYGHKLKKLNANDLVYTKTNTVTEVFRSLTEYSFIKNNEVKESCLFAIKYSKGKCFYCGKPLIVFDDDNIMHEIIDDDGELKPHSDTCECYFNSFFGLHHYQMDHLYPAADLCVPYKGAMVLACNSCNNAKSDKTPMYFIGELHRKRLADIICGLPEDLVQSVYVDDYNDHINLLKQLISMYYQESINHDTYRLFINATGFDPKKMIEEKGSIDFDRILGRNESTTYPSYDLNNYDEKHCYEFRDVPRMSEEEAMRYVFEETQKRMELSSSPREMNKDICDMNDPFIENYFIYDNLGRGEEKNNTTRLQKSEVQRVIRKYFNGGDFTNITSPEEIYRRLDPYLTMKMNENDEKLSTIKNSSIYSVAKLSMKLVLKAFGKDIEIPNAVIFKQLKVNDIPYEMWDTILTINDKCLKSEGSTSYIEGICFLIKKHNWGSSDLLMNFLNGDLAREEIPYHVRNVPENERTKYIAGSFDKKGNPNRSNFCNNIESRGQKWAKAVIRYHKEVTEDYQEGDRYDTPTPVEIRRMFNFEDPLTYNDMEVAYNNIRSKYFKQNSKGEKVNDYCYYGTLDKNWIAKGILDFNHGLSGLNESIKSYVGKHSDELQGKERDNVRNAFAKIRKSILTIMIPVIRSKVASEGSGSEWVERGWTSEPVYDDDLEDWASNSTLIPSSTINAEDVAKTVKNITKSDWIYEQVKGREWNWTKGLDEFIAVIDEVVSQISHGAGIEDYIPDDHDRKAIYWTMMSKSDGISKDYDRSEWLKKIKWFFNEDDLPTIRRSDPGKEPIYSLIFRLSKHRHVDFVELCELMSMIVGTDKSSIQTLDECIDLESIESKLDELDYNSYIDTIGIRSIRTEAVQRAYHSIVGDEPAWKVNELPYKKKQKLCGGLGKIMKTYRWYLENIHHEIPSSVISRIPDTVSTILLFIDQQQ